jgi:hypothetical protein
MAHAVTGAREDKIDHAVSAASELIGFLQDAGPVNGAQARIIIEAAVRATVGNAEEWEVRASAKRIAADLEGAGKSENQSSDVR